MYMNKANVIHHMKPVMLSGWVCSEKTLSGWVTHYILQKNVGCNVLINRSKEFKVLLSASTQLLPVYWHFVPLPLYNAPKCEKAFAGFIPGPLHIWAVDLLNTIDSPPFG